MVDEKENQPRSFKKDHHHPKPLEYASAFGDGKLWIKLKKPKDEGNLDEDKDQNNTKVCQVCNKVFGSGKALGGHMRIHVQAYKQLISKKKLKAKQSITFKKHKRQQVVDFVENKDFTKSTNVAAGDNIKKPRCVLCGKKFPSMKSLFGHMRCHPERDWRGVEPPPAAKNSSSSSVSDAEPENVDDHIDSAGTNEGCAVDLFEPLPGWSVTAKRGRKAAIANTSAISSSDEDRVAAHYLMLLACGDSFESGLTHKQKGEEFEATNSNSLTYKVENEDSNPIVRSKRQRIEEFPNAISDDQTLMQLRDEREHSVDGVEGLQPCGVMNLGKGKSVVESADWPNGKVTIIKNKKKRKKMKLRDLEHVQDHASPVHQMPVMMAANSTPDKYRCSTCDKCLPTHQALGGHRASHNKFRIVIHNSIDDSSSAAAEDENLANPISQVEENKESEEAASSKLQVEGTHQCNICNKLFSSGQALGGHKRCHWNGPMEAQSSQVMSPGEGSITGRGILDFDLNEAPPLDDEAGVDSEQVAGYGYASSSYNSVA